MSTKRSPRAKSALSRAFGIEADQRAFARVTADLGLNLRDAPNTSARIVATLPKDGLVYLRDVGPVPVEAFRPVCTVDGLAGFVWAAYLREA